MNMRSDSVLSLPEILFPHFIRYLDDSSLARLGQCSRVLHEAIVHWERKNFYHVIEKGNRWMVFPLEMRKWQDIEHEYASGDYLQRVQDEKVMRIEKLIEKREEELQIKRFPFYLREFVRICGIDMMMDQRVPFHDRLLHPVNALLPFEQWEKLDESTVFISNKDQSNRFILIGRLRTSSSFILLDSLNGVLYSEVHCKLTKLLTLKNW